jgi:hypothetical protein
LACRLTQCTQRERTLDLVLDILLACLLNKQVEVLQCLLAKLRALLGKCRIKSARCRSAQLANSLCEIAIEDRRQCLSHITELALTTGNPAKALLCLSEHLHLGRFLAQECAYLIDSLPLEWRDIESGLEPAEDVTDAAEPDTLRATDALTTLRKPITETGKANTGCSEYLS